MVVEKNRLHTFDGKAFDNQFHTEHKWRIKNVLLNLSKEVQALEASLVCTNFKLACEQALEKLKINEKLN